MSFGALSSGISALQSFSKGMEVIGNNIANVNTISFKGSRIKYSETFNQVLTQSAPSAQDGLGSNVTASQVGLGVQVDTIQGLFHQGGLSTTNQKTDLAISGEGFFKVVDTLNNNREFGTRGGDFRVDDRGFLVTTEGYRVQGKFDGAIGFNAAVDSDGRWTFTKNEDPTSGTITPTRIGDIRLDYNKDQANEQLTPYGTTSQARNAVYYSNDLISDDYDGTHAVGVVNLSAGAGSSVDSTFGWHAFAEDAVKAIKGQRNLVAGGETLLTDQDIEAAVSDDFFAMLFADEAGSHGLGGTAITTALDQLGVGVVPGTTVTAIQSLIPATQALAEARVDAVRAEATPDLTNFSIDPEGAMRYFLSDGSSFIRGQVMLLDFNDKTALIREGRNLYSGFGAAGIKGDVNVNDGLRIAGREGLGRIQQGALELSNVDLTNEFAQMITTQRGFQAGSRIITVSDDILQEVVNLKR